MLKSSIIKINQYLDKQIVFEYEQHKDLSTTTCFGDTKRIALDVKIVE